MESMYETGETFSMSDPSGNKFGMLLYPLSVLTYDQWETALTVKQEANSQHPQHFRQVQLPPLTDPTHSPLHYAT